MVKGGRVVAINKIEEETSLATHTLHLNRMRAPSIHGYKLSIYEITNPSWKMGSDVMLPKF